MESGTQLAKRFKEVILDGKWIANTNWKEVIDSITWQQATQKIGDLNTIALLTFHVNYYIAGVLNVFKGGDLEIRDKFSFEAPPIHSAADWEALKNELYLNADQFTTYVEKMSEAQLEAGFVKEEYGNYRRNIEGMIEHCYYHFGQVVLLRKLVNSTIL